MTLTVGIAGITGKFGRVLTSSLLKYPEVKIKGYCRTPSKVPTSFSSSPRISLAQGEAFDIKSLHAFAKGCDVVVCCYLGDDKIMTDGQKALIDACDEEGVSRYVASDWSLDYDKIPFGALFPKDPMKHVKAYLENKKTTKGVHILVGGFMEAIFSPLLGIFNPMENKFMYWGTGDEIFEGSTYLNSAQYTAAVCVDREATGVQRLVGGRASTKEIAVSFEKVYGIKPIIECLGSLEELYVKMHQQREKEPQNLYSYMFLFYYYYMANGSTLVGPKLDNDKYADVKPMNWEDFMRNTPLEHLPGSIAAVGRNL
ncbi:uncharacterized protein Z518_02496 [Rhinocladiella mackenziei CBS 650.93]|uniref:NAD(P)-binding domain-containing protein n=1 Tax=Rhinocladiella mackenziei CBS 650.93 TaxID=1442369 RepID=A0A0D2FZV0_9EURO|nr:uncharacterized protein Z518_02496 [Rhinocladiella mackenziei CBS 650.93]KIX07842.1 hypothetical protein Z518_02496 [Rhinocladiella mackenziei CBS 650.93]